MARILLVDDDTTLLTLMRRILEPAGYEILTQNSAEGALNLVRSGTPLDLIVCDYQMPEMSGLELLAKLQDADIEIPVIIVTGHATIDHAVHCLKAGACDYLVKPFEPGQLERVVEIALNLTELRRVNEELRNQLRALSGSGQVIGESAALIRILELLATVAPTRTTVLLQGESGTGKEVLARAVHDMSGRIGPFVSINCAALPEALVESILFGHEKGAFTGAVKQTKGAFERADGGTLLLDEVSEMRLDLQAKLLRVLQEQEFERVGGSVPVRVNTRILATTNRDLRADVEEGRFREDLFYRLAVIPVQVPPLRERREDIPLLAMHFLRKAAVELNRPLNGFSPQAMERLQSHAWPGNVRELAHIVERAAILSEGPVLGASDFALPDRRRSGTPSPGTSGVVEQRLEEGRSEEVVVALETLNLAQAERVLIERALEATDQNRTRAAELLGISIRTLRNRLNHPTS